MSTCTFTFKLQSCHGSSPLSTHRLALPHLHIHPHAASLLSKFLIILRSTKGHLWQTPSPSITSPQVIRFSIHFARSNVGHHSQYHPKYLLCVKCYIKPYHDISLCNSHSYINSSRIPYWKTEGSYCLSVCITTPEVVNEISWNFLPKQVSGQLADDYILGTTCIHSKELSHCLVHCAGKN